jgi:heme exporter protein B
MLTSLVAPTAAIVVRDLSLARRRGGGAALGLLFFVLASVLYPLGIGPEPGLLGRAATGLLWVTALLAVLLSLDRLFQADWEDGSLDLLLLSPLPLPLVVTAKCVAHWLLTGLPLVLASPVLGLLLQLPPAALPVLMLSMLLGTPTLTLLGAVGAALTLGASRGGVLMTLLVLPLYIPVLIFGAGAVEAGLSGPGARPHFLILGAFLMAALALVPWTAAAALRQAAE